MLRTLPFAVMFSLDAFFAGIACGLRKVRFPAATGILVGVISAAFLAAGGLLGNLLGSAIPAQVGRWLGGGLLGGLGVWILWSTHKSDPAAGSLTGDRDASGDLSFRELAWLGVGLGSDGLAGAAALGLSGTGPTEILLLAIVLAFTTGSAFHAGHRLARITGLAGQRWTRSASGWLLIVVGLLRLRW